MTPDDQLTRLMDRAVAGLEPPTERLIRGALERGRRLRRQRRLVQAASGTALVGLIAVVAVSIVPGNAPAGLGQGPGATSNSAASNSAATPQPDATHPAGKPNAVSMSPQLLVQTAVALLPRKGTITQMTGRAMAGNVLAEFVYDDGNGPAQIDVALGFEQDGVNGVVDDCHPNDPIYTETCTSRPDGSHLATFVADDPSKPTEYAARLIRPDGVEIDISEWNAPQEKDAAASRPAPPLTMSELVAFDSDPSWTPWVTRADNAAAAGSFVPDYSYDRRAQRQQREREAAADARAARESARVKARRQSKHDGGH